MIPLKAFLFLTSLSKSLSFVEGISLDSNEQKNPVSLEFDTIAEIGKLNVISTDSQSCC